MSILDRIVEDTREDLARRKAAVPLTDLETAKHFGRTPLDFSLGLSKPGISIISEIKKASPSKGVIRHDYQPRQIARQYEQAGAAAISVLTEPRHFQGSLEHLSEVRSATSLPLLRKDFIVDVYQLFEARAYGADAVLLIAAVLDRVQLSELLQACSELALTALVELYDEQELERIDFDLVSVVGVNNRDLRTFEVDLGHSLRVFAAIPEDVLRVSESGISSAQELIYLEENGVDAALIGEAFMRATDPGDELARLMNELQAAPES